MLSCCVILTNVELMSGVEGKPPSPAELADVRSRALARLQELGSGAVLEEDIVRLRNSDEYVRR